MPYLPLPRLTFSGQLQTGPFPLNHDPAHVESASFKSGFQPYAPVISPNGWRNPAGMGNGRLVDYQITSVTYQDGSASSDPLEDSIIGLFIRDTEAPAAGKIVNTDSQQPVISRPRGRTVRLVNHQGATLMRGDYQLMPPLNAWLSCPVDRSAAAVYQSVIRNINWQPDYAASRYLRELRAVSPRALSIHFTLDCGQEAVSSPGPGRLTGIIGPAPAAEPSYLTRAMALLVEPVKKTIRCPERSRRRISMHL